METFISDYLEKKRTAKFLWSVNYYFLFLARNDLLQKSNSIREQLVQKTRKPFKLKDFRGVRSVDVAQLETLGIIDVVAMLERGKTSELRKQIEAGWDEEQIRASWQPALDQYKEKRKSYLIYD